MPLRPWIRWVQHVLMNACNPATPRNFWSNGHTPPNRCFAQNCTRKGGPDDRCCRQSIPHLHHTAGMQQRHTRRQGGASWGPVDLAWLNGHGCPRGQALRPINQWPCKKTKGNMPPIGIIWMLKPQLRIRGIGDAHPQLCNVMGFVFIQRKPKLGRINHHETVAAIGRIDR